MGSEWIFVVSSYMVVTFGDSCMYPMCFCDSLVLVYVCLLHSYIYVCIYIYIYTNVFKHESVRRGVFMFVRRGAEA